MAFQPLPALVILRIKFLASFGPPFRYCQPQAALKHEGLSPLSHPCWFEHLGAPILKTVKIRPVWSHDTMQSGPSWPKTPLFRFILSENQPHKFRHAIPVVVRGPECVFLH